MTLESLTIFPVKSCGAVELRQARVEERGLQHDRRWMIVDETGRFLTQREVPQLATIRPHLAPDTLILRCGDAELDLPLHPHHGETMRVQVWRDEVDALCVGPLADDWLRDALGLDARLVWMPDTTRRLVDTAFARTQEITSFADGFPFLLLTSASVHDLNTRIIANGAAPIEPDRFRANFLIAGATPNDEDNWVHFRIGDCEFEAVKPCARCPIPTINQTSGQKTGPEPLRTLATYRKRGDKIFFAQNILPRTLGQIHLGDEIEVLTRRPTPSETA